MKLSKKQIGNAIWILAIALIVFTPVGFHLRVMVSKLFATGADIISVEEQQTLENYNWQLADIKGNRYNFESSRGEVVLLNFWATWCPPCVAELPSLEKLHKDYKDKVTFAFVANDKVDRVSAFLKKKGYDLPVYFQATAVPGELEHSSIPTTYIISKSGKIVVAESGVANWNSKSTRDLLNQLLKQ
ncbi:redoxin domain-containing protein [Muricauda sp. JGD-17]|uniref:Redoxin domain-containing protein n=1 Tax=Flagellimonas ochracea TaxID=2696472 RepID=A0A964WZ31_9FLAO|nr:TlpA disulfide reductase family protein [Allomuricauda ochracea]NAY93309.1 redoxin domain-containing protein [Allomuricauda ochracea]